MKNIIKTSLLLLALILTLTGCTTAKDDKVIKVGASITRMRKS